MKPTNEMFVSSIMSPKKLGYAVVYTDCDVQNSTPTLWGKARNQFCVNGPSRESITFVLVFHDFFLLTRIIMKYHRLKYEEKYIFIHFKRIFFKTRVF